MRLIIVTGGAAAVTDLGRRRTPIMGVQTNGAADQTSARAANILVGNPQDHPMIEATALFPFAFSVDEHALISVTGAAASMTIDGISFPTHTPTFVWPGATVEVPAAPRGLRTYIGVHGLLEGSTFLGSHTFDPLTSSGTFLDTGTSVAVSANTLANLPDITRIPVRAPRPECSETARIGLLPGPELGEFDGFFAQAETSSLRVSTNSDHVGLRLEGHTFTRSGTSEILSRGVPVGAVEIPPSGDPIVLLRGRPLTAGYPIPAVIGRGWHDAIGQLRPGDSIEFFRATQARSVSLAQSKRDALDQLEQASRAVFARNHLFPTGS